MSGFQGIFGDIGSLGKLAGATGRAQYSQQRRYEDQRILSQLLAQQEAANQRRQEYSLAQMGQQENARTRAFEMRQAADMRKQATPTAKLNTPQRSPSLSPAHAAALAVHNQAEQLQGGGDEVSQLRQLMNAPGSGEAPSATLTPSQGTSGIPLQALPGGGVGVVGDVPPVIEEAYMRRGGAVNATQPEQLDQAQAVLEKLQGEFTPERLEALQLMAADGGFKDMNQLRLAMQAFRTKEDSANLPFSETKRANAATEIADIEGTIARLGAEFQEADPFRQQEILSLVTELQQKRDIAKSVLAQRSVGVGQEIAPQPTAPASSEGGYQEGQIVEDAAGNRLVLRNNQWVSM